jgi:hypothetical protein
LQQAIKDYLEKCSCFPQVKLMQGHEQKYRIEMKNKYLDPEGKCIKTQELISTFSRCITEVSNKYIAASDYCFHNVEFSSKQISKPMRWTFAEGLNIYHYLFCCRTYDMYLVLSEQENKEMIMRQYNKCREVLGRLPKLPSAYLLIMQAYDIIGLESIASQLCSTQELFENPGVEKVLSNLSFLQEQIGLGLYEDSSFFKNGEFRAVFLGMGMYRGRLCSICEYMCDESKVKMTDTGSGVKRTRQGSSYYSGTIYIDIETGLPVLGTMLESYVAMQNKGNESGLPEVPIHVRRAIRMEFMEEA